MNLHPKDLVARWPPEKSVSICGFPSSKGGEDLMTTDWNVSLPGGENTRFMLKEETLRIIGCAFEFSKELGHGLHEKFERVVS